MNIKRILHKNTLGIMLVLIGFLVIPFFMDDPYKRVLLNKIILSIIVLLGLNFITGIVGQMNVGTAGIYGLGAYTYALLVTNFDVSPWLAILAALVVGLAVGLILGYPSLKISGIYLALATISFGETVRILLLNMVKVTGGSAGVSGIKPISLFGWTLGKNSNGFYYLLLAFMIMFILISHRIINSKWGRSFKATRDNQEAVATCGISIASVKVRAFLLAAVFASVAGAFYAALMGFLTPSDFSSDMSIKFIMMLMVGGVGTIAGCIAGAFAVTLIPELLRVIGDTYWFIFAGLVLLSAIFLPHGIISLPGKMWQIGKDLFARKGVKRGIHIEG